MTTGRFQIEVRQWLPLAVDESELLTLSEAAKRLGLWPKVNSVASLVERGRLRRVQDLAEPNPKKRTRVFAADVEQELARRRARRREGDMRLRGMDGEAVR